MGQDSNKTLYEQLKSKGLYTKSYEEFNSQFSTPESQERLYNGMKEKGFYTKDLNSFRKQFFFSSDGPTASPLSSEDTPSASATTESPVSPPLGSESVKPDSETTTNGLTTPEGYSFSTDVVNQPVSGEELDVGTSAVAYTEPQVQGVEPESIEPTLGVKILGKGISGTLNAAAGAALTPEWIMEFSEDLFGIDAMSNPNSMAFAMGVQALGEAGRKLKETGEVVSADFTPEGMASIEESLRAKDWSGAAESFALQAAEAVPLFAMMMLAPQAGVSQAGTLTGMGALTGALKKEEIDESGKDMGMMAHGIAAGTGLSEAVSELFTYKLGGQVAKVFKESGEEAAQKFAKSAFEKTFDKLSGKYPVLFGFSGEGITEAANGFAQNAIDKYSGYNPDIDLMENVFDQFVVGGAMGGAGATPLAYQSIVTQANIKKIDNQLADIDKALEAGTLPQQAIDRLERDAEALESQKEALKQRDYEAFKNATPEQLNEITDVKNRIDEAKAIINDPSTPTSVSDYYKNEAKKDFEKLQELEQKIQQPSEEETVDGEKLEVKGAISPETSDNYANLTEDGNDFIFFHTSDKELNEIDPKRFGSNPAAVTQKGESAAWSKVGGGSFYYTRPTDTESMVYAPNLYAVRVPKEKVYDFNSDVNNYYDEAKARHEKEHPGKAFDFNTQLAYITKIAGENGFDMVVARWGGKTRAQSTSKLSPSDRRVTSGNQVVKPFDTQYESNDKKGWKPVPPEAQAKKLDDVYQKISKAVGDDYKNPLYNARMQSSYEFGDNFSPFKSREDMNRAVEESNLPEELKQEYRDAVNFEGTPGKSVNTKAGKALFSEPVEGVSDISSSYKERKGIDKEPGERIENIDIENAKKLADAFDEMKHDPNNPEVKEAYEAMAEETMEQYEEVKEAGYVFEIFEGEGEPYKNSQEMLKDLRDNKHLYILSTAKEFGQRPITEAQRAENPLLRDSGVTDVNGKPLLINDVFRGVHDFFGHGERGNSFGPKGEENAWDVHSRMFSDKAARAMTTETRGQNSWVNFGKHNRNEDGSIKKKGDKGYVPPKDRPFAEQKIGLLPKELSDNPYIEKSSDKKANEVETNPVEVKGAPKGTFLNVGLLEGKTKTEISEQEVEAALPEDVKVIEKERIEPGNNVDEPTLYLEISRPLTSQEMADFRAKTKQISVPQLSEGKGVMYGSKETEDWGDFNPEYFVGKGGEKLSDMTSTNNDVQSIQAKDRRELAKINEEVFGLDKKQAKAAAAVTDKIIGTMAKREGISKKEMYGKISFTNQAPGEGALYQDGEGSPFYSVAEAGISKVKQDKATPEQWISQISKFGGRGASQELTAIGLEEYLNQWVKDNNAKSVPKEVVEQYIRDNQIQVNEISKTERKAVPNLVFEKDSEGDYVAEEVTGNWTSDFVISKKENGTYEVQFPDGTIGEAESLEDAKFGAQSFYLSNEIEGDVQYDQYRQRGESSNYREFLFTLPDISNLSSNRFRALNGDKNFKGPHFEEKNIIAHVRTTDRTLPNGEKVLFVEEVQSDWAQRGRSKGFTDEKLEAKIDEFNSDQIRFLELQKKEARERRLATEHPEYLNALEKVKASNYVKGTNFEGDNKTYIYEKKSDGGVDVGKIIDRADVPKDVLDAFDKLDEIFSEYNKAKQEREELGRKYGYEASRWAREDGIEYKLKMPEDIRDYDGTVPDMPHKKTDQWAGLAIRGILKKAADEGYDRVAFVTGEQSQKSVGGELAGQIEFYNNILPKIAGKEAARFDKSAKVGVSDFSDIKIESLEVSKDTKKNGDTFWFANGLVNGEMKVGKSTVSEADAIRKLKESAAGISKQLSIPITSKMRMNLSQGAPLFQGKKGAMSVKDGRFIVHAMTNPNVSTPLHEIAHVYEHYLKDGERSAVLNWTGQKEWDVDTSEKFARGFEKYLSEGKAPNSRLGQIFEDFKQWLTDIYNGISGSDIDVKLNDEMRALYDTMLGGKEVESTGTEPKGKKMRQFAKKAEERLGLDKKTGQDIIDDPENYYEPQVLTKIKGQLSEMTDGELLENMTDSGINSIVGSRSGLKGLDSNIEMLARGEQMRRAIDRGENIAPLIKEMAKLQTNAGQILRQAQEIPGFSDVHIVKFIREVQKQAGKELTDAQVNEITKLAKRFDKANRDLKKAAENRVNNEDQSKTKTLEKQLKKAEREVAQANKLMNSWINKNVPKDWKDMLQMTIQGNLLTILSQATNVWANIFELGKNVAKSPFDYIAGRAISAITGERQVIYNPLRAHTIGMKYAIKGLQEAWHNAIYGGAFKHRAKNEIKESFKPIQAINQLLSKDARKDMTLNEKFKKAYEGTFGVAPEVMFRLLAFGDKPFLRWMEAVEMYNQGRAIGLKGSKLDAFIRAGGGKARETAEAAGMEAVFMGESTIAKAAEKAAYGIKNAFDANPRLDAVTEVVFTMFAPYIKTPSNIISKVIDIAVPGVAIAKGAMYASKGQNKKAADAFGTAILGVMLGMAAKAIVDAGLMTSGGNDDDKAERELKYMTTYPNSINISGLKRLLKGEDPTTRGGDKIINLEKTGTLGAALLIHAKSYEKAKEKEKNRKRGEAVPGNIERFLSEQIPLAGTIKYSLDQSFLTGTNTILNALQSDQKYAHDKFIKAIVDVTGAIALPNTLASINRAVMDYIPERGQETLNDMVINMIRERTFQSDKLPIKHDFWGRPVKQTPDGRNAFIYNLIDVTKMRDVNMDKATKEIWELYLETRDKSVIPKSQDWTVYDSVSKERVVLTPEERSRLNKEVGKKRHELVTEAVNDPKWSQATDAEKVAWLKALYSAGFATAVGTKYDIASQKE
jgi:hypothetical protein